MRVIRRLSMLGAGQSASRAGMYWSSWTRQRSKALELDPDEYLGRAALSPTLTSSHKPTKT
jgi:hypothetical protein